MNSAGENISDTDADDMKGSALFEEYKNGSDEGGCSASALTHNWIPASDSSQWNLRCWCSSAVAAEPTPDLNIRVQRFLLGKKPRAACA